MNAKSILDKIKAAFAGETAPAPAAKVMFSYSVDNGGPVFVDCTDDGIAGIDQNDKVYTDKEMTAAYPDGTYNITGTQYGFSVADGVVTSVTDAAGTGSGNPLEMQAPPALPAAIVPPVPITPPAQMGTYEAVKNAFASATQIEDLSKIFEAFATGTPEERITKLETVCRALMESSFGWQIREAQQKGATDAAIEIYKKDLTTAQTAVATASVQLAKHEETIKGMFELCEALVKEPTTDPRTLTENQRDGFAARKEASLQAKADALSAIKNKSKNKAATV